MGKEIKLAAIVPVGPLDSMGYQYNSTFVLKNLSHYFDYVLVGSNTRRTKKLDFQHPKIKFFSNEEYWDPEINGAEKLNISNQVTSKLLAEARKLDVDFVVNVSVNQYIDDYNFDRLKIYCIELLENDIPWGWLYKSYQIGTDLTYPNIRLPWVINIRHSKEMKFLPDSLLYKDKVISHENGFFEYAPFALIDLFCEFNANDLECKKAFLKGTNWDVGLAIFEESEYRELQKYFQRKLSSKVLNKKYKLSKWGVEAYKNYPPDSILNSLKKSYTPYWKAKFFKLISNFLKNKQV